MMMENNDHDLLLREFKNNNNYYYNSSRGNFIEYQAYLQLITTLHKQNSHKYQSDIEFAVYNSYEQFIYTLFIFASTLLAYTIKFRKQYRYIINEDGVKYKRGTIMMASFNLSNLEATLAPQSGAPESSGLGLISGSSSAAFLKELLLDTSTIFDADYPSQGGDTVAETLASLTSTSSPTSSSSATISSSSSQSSLDSKPITSSFQSTSSNFNVLKDYFETTTTTLIGGHKQNTGNDNNNNRFTEHSRLPDLNPLIGLYDNGGDIATTTASTTSLGAYNPDNINNNSLPMRMARRLALYCDNLLIYLQNRFQDHTAASVASLSVVIIVVTILFCIIINWSREEEKRVKESYKKLARGSSQSNVLYEASSSNVANQQSSSTPTSNTITHNNINNNSNNKSKNLVSISSIKNQKIKKGTTSISHHDNRFCSLFPDFATPTSKTDSLLLSSSNNIDQTNIISSSAHNINHGFLTRNRDNSSYSELTSKPSETSETEAPSSPTALIPPTSKSTSPLSSPSFHNAAISLFINNSNNHIANIRSTSALSDQYHRIETVTPTTSTTIGKTSPSSGSASNHHQQRRNLHIVELRRETYFGLVRLTKPGCRTIVLFCDVQSRDKLLTKFCQCIYPYRKNKALQFAFLLIEKNISWYKAILRLALHEKRDLHINPINCIGTVLCLNGFKKHFSVYHASDSRCDPDEPCLLLEESLLDNFPPWLEQLFAGKTNRYYVKYWPEQMR